LKRINAHEGPYRRSWQITDGLGLDRDAAFAFEVQRVENLVAHFARLNRARQFQQPVGERGFAEYSHAELV